MRAVASFSKPATPRQRRESTPVCLKTRGKAGCAPPPATRRRDDPPGREIATKRAVRNGLRFAPGPPLPPLRAFEQEAAFWSPAARLFGEPRLEAHLPWPPRASTARPRARSPRSPRPPRPYRASAAPEGRPGPRPPRPRSPHRPARTHRPARRPAACDQSRSAPPVEAPHEEPARSVRPRPPEPGAYATEALTPHSS